MVALEVGIFDIAMDSIDLFAFEKIYYTWMSRISQGKMRLDRALLRTAGRVRGSKKKGNCLRLG